MKIWWLLVILALLLLVWGVRENFESTLSIKAPPYDAAEKERIYNMVRNRSASPPYTFLGYQDLLMARAKTLNPNESDEQKLRQAAGGLVSPAIETFFTTVYKPASTPITPANVDTFMTTRTSDLKDVEKDIITTYFIGQGGVGGSAYADTLAAMGQNYGYARVNPADATSGTTSGATGTTSGGTGTTSGGTGTTSGATGTTSGATGTTSGATGTTSGATGTTSGATGTTSASSSGSSSGSGSANGRKQLVFGPTFTGMAEGDGVSGYDSSKTNQYPELIGGGGTSTSTRGTGGSEAGFGFGNLGIGALPSTSGLGSDPNNRFFPTSREPGDMELIPDPYRVSQQFQNSSYSFKTEPVPFLTDFSAFYR